MDFIEALIIKYCIIVDISRDTNGYDCRSINSKILNFYKIKTTYSFAAFETGILCMFNCIRSDLTF